MRTIAFLVASVLSVVSCAGAGTVLDLNLGHPPVSAGSVMVNTSGVVTAPSGLLTISNVYVPGTNSSAYFRGNGAGLTNLSQLLADGMINSAGSPLVAERWTTSVGGSIPIIYDEDMLTDCDDSGHLATLHALMTGGKVRIIACGSTVLGTNSARVISAINFFYGRTNIPVGYSATSTINPGPFNAYSSTISTNWLPRYGYNPVPGDVISIYRQALVNEQAGTVKMTVGGQMRNIYNLMISPPDSISALTGFQLMTNKVSELVIVGGMHPTGIEYNFDTDGPSCINLFPILTNGTGIAVTFIPANIGNVASINSSAPYSGTELIMSHPEDSPVRMIYDMVLATAPQGSTWATGRPSWGQLAAVWAAFGTNAGLFATAGTNVVYDGGDGHWHNLFTDAVGGPHRVLQISSGMTNTLATMIAGLQSSPGILLAGGSSLTNITGRLSHDVLGNQNSELVFTVGNDSVSNMSSSVHNILAGSTVAQIAVLSQNYYNTNGYGTNAGALEFINRSGPILFKTDFTGLGHVDGATALMIMDHRKLAANGYTSSAAGMSATSMSLGSPTVDPGLGGLYVDGNSYFSSNMTIYPAGKSYLSFAHGASYLGSVGIDDGGSIAVGAAEHDMVIRYQSGPLTFANTGGNRVMFLEQNGDLQVAGALKPNASTYVQIAGPVALDNAGSSAKSWVHFFNDSSTYRGTIGVDDGGNIGVGVPTGEMVLRYQVGNLNFAPGGTVKAKIAQDGTITAPGYVAGTQAGIAATVDVLVAGGTTNRMVYVGGILVSNIVNF